MVWECVCLQLLLLRLADQAHRRDNRHDDRRFSRRLTTLVRHIPDPCTGTVPHMPRKWLSSGLLQGHRQVCKECWWLSVCAGR